MDYIVTSDEMKRCDQYIIKEIGMPSMVLMERAALVTVDELMVGGSNPGLWDYDLAKVLCVCGTGNNGGDGFAIARLLHLKGIPVEILTIGDPKKRSAETELQSNIAKNYGITILDKIPEKLEYTTIIDALLGIGLKRPLTGEFSQAIQLMNGSKSGGTRILSVDVPSGISTDTGEIMGVAVMADKTVTFAYNKLGLTMNSGKEFAGELKVRDIGITEIGFDGDLPKHKELYYWSD